MGLLEEIERMKQSGMQEGEIILRLQEQGNPYRAISEAMSQSKIKQAVQAPEEPPLPPAPEEMPEAAPMPEQMQEASFAQPEAAPQQEFSGYGQESQMSQQGYTQSPQYDYSQSPLSSDTIMEISEQIVSEKLADVRKKLEKMSSFKTELETKTENIEDRLKRIEKIIDSLQASVLRKVGDYVTNVEDIKQELIESQKTFAKVLGTKHKPEHKK